MHTGSNSATINKGHFKTRNTEFFDLMFNKDPMFFDRPHVSYNHFKLHREDTPTLFNGTSTGLSDFGL